MLLITGAGKLLTLGAGKLVTLRVEKAASQMCC